MTYRELTARVATGDKSVTTEQLVTAYWDEKNQLARAAFAPGVWERRHWEEEPEDYYPEPCPACDYAGTCIVCRMRRTK